MSRLTIGIFGGTGFIGTRLCSRFAADGHDLRVPSRYREGGRHLLVLPSLQLIQADTHDPEALPALVEGCDVVINLVGILNERGRRGDGFRAAHTTFTRNVVRACRQAGVPRLLQMSALKANAQRGPSHYLRTKGEAEQVIRDEAGDALAWTIFQPSVVFGPEDSFVNRFAGLLRWLPVLPLARPEARFAPVFVEDVVEAFVRSLRDPATHGRTYQLCGPEQYTLREIVTFIAATARRRRLVIGLPDWLSRLQAAVMDFVPGKPFSTDNYLSLTVASTCTEDGLEALGIAPRSMQVVVPSYLASQDRRAYLSILRKGAGRRP